MSRWTSGWRRAFVLGLALLGALVTFALGRWQLGRAAEKAALQAAMVERQRLPVLDGAKLGAPLAPDRLDTLVHRAVALRGRWMPERSVYLDNRVMERRTGFYVLTPLRLTDHDVVVLVQRGWAPRNFEDRQSLPPVTTQPGEVLISGRIAEQPARAYALGAEDRGTIRQNLDLHAFRAETGLPLANWVVWQTGAPSDGLQRHWPEPESGVAKHDGYAFQWFGLCALIVVLVLWFQVVRPIRSSTHA